MSATRATETPPGRQRRFAPDRVLAFSDGVFAIAITLLILPLTELDLGPENLGSQLSAAVPQMVSFVLGFLVIGLYWLSHHEWFSQVVKVDDRLLKINLVLLLCVVFLPFPTAVLGDHGGSASTVFYAGAVATTGAAFAATWTYLIRHPDLLEADTAAPLKRHTLVGLVTPVIFAASIPVALLSANSGQLFWILIWPGSILASRIARRRTVQT